MKQVTSKNLLQHIEKHRKTPYNRSKRSKAAEKDADQSVRRKRVPDAKTIWLFLDTLTKNGVTQDLFAEFNAMPIDNGMITHTGTIVDATAANVHDSNQFTEFLNESGAPQIVLYNGAKTRPEWIHIENIYISISHEQEQALAFAVIE